MIRNPAPAIAYALTGFVLGVVVTLVATGAFTTTSHTAAPVPTLLPPTPIAGNTLYVRVHRIVVHQLGALYNPTHADPHQHRLISLRLVPVPPYEVPAPDLSGHMKYRSVVIVFRLNDHPLGAHWRMLAAKADVFAVLKALYTSQLPVFNVEMYGRFPLKTGKTMQDHTVLVIAITHRIASHVPWKRWGREDEGKAWNLLSYRRVDPRFA